MRIPNGRKASSTAAMMQAAAGIVPPSPAPFDADRIQRRRRFKMDDLNARHFWRGGKQIIGIIGRHRLPILVVDHPFEQRIADAVHYTPAHLTVDEHRIDQSSAVVADDVAQDFHAHSIKSNQSKADV